MNCTYLEEDEFTIYDLDDTEVLLEEDIIEDFEEGFMRGYLAY